MVSVHRLLDETKRYDKKPSIKKVKKIGESFDRSNSSMHKSREGRVTVFRE